MSNKYEVLIESDWNLKRIDSSSILKSSSVLIESDWNLKPLNCFHHLHHNQY